MVLATIGFMTVKRLNMLSKDEQRELDEKVARELSEKEFDLRSIGEAEIMSKKIATEINDVLRNYGASLAEWNHRLYVVPPGFSVYSMWNFPRGVIWSPPIDSELRCNEFNCDYRIVKPFPRSDKQ